MLTNVKGYTYKATKVTDFVAIFMFAIYIVIVVIHIVATSFGGQSFSSWSSIEELVLLAKNSTPSHDTDLPDAKEGTTPAVSSDSSGVEDTRSQGLKRREDPARSDQLNPLLAHTSSGIRSLRTMRLRMKIKTDTRSREETLQMVFTDGEADPFKPVSPDKPY